jgi:hypothetical protein
LEVRVANPVIEMATTSRLVAHPGQSIQLTYRWSSGTGRDPAEVVTELIPETQRRPAFRSTHARQPVAETESGTAQELSYSQELIVPRDLAPGTYQITVRMTRLGGGIMGVPIFVGAGRGVTRIGTGPNSRCVIGYLTVVAP